MGEVEFGGKPLKKNAPKSMAVKRAQEWLYLNGFGLSIDGDFGPATETCVKQFQKKKGLPVTGVVNQPTHHALVAPMRAALKPINPTGKTINQLIVAYARQHVAQHPREVGGQNRGPWVRLYMDGHDGDEWLWCAGFATYPIKQAAETLGKAIPVLRSFGVANIANHAKSHERFLGLPNTANRKKIKAGSLFLERGGPNSYMHTGIVVSHDGETMKTIEGNSNEGGSNNGYEALSRTRWFKSMDFALV